MNGSKEAMLVLGIETSCDETACALVEDGKSILSNVISSSLPLHRRFGGVVPEIACRAHVECINYILDEALRQARANLKDIELVAVTSGPGLVGSLLVGISVAKAIAYPLHLPLVGVNHLEAHLEANFLDHPRPKTPFVGLLISGGHTSLVYRRSPEANYELLGRTHDDACGEAFDKVAKILGLGYPGGPAIDQKAKDGDPDRITFPRVFLKKGSLDFSFSGIKTAVLYYVRDHEVKGLPRALTIPSRGPGRKGQVSRRKRKDAGPPASVADIAASFQEAVVDTLIGKVLLACRKMRASLIVVGGGVAANSRLRKKLSNHTISGGIEVLYPPPSLCTDNACMVACLGYYQFKARGIVSDLSLTANPNLQFGKTAMGTVPHDVTYGKY